MNEQDLEFYAHKTSTEKEEILKPTGFEESLSDIYSRTEENKIPILRKMVGVLSASKKTARNRGELILKLGAAKWLEQDQKFQELSGQLLRTGTDSDLVAEELEIYLRNLIIQLTKEKGSAHSLKEENIPKNEEKNIFIDLAVMAQSLLFWNKELVQIMNMFLSQEQKEAYAGYFNKNEAVSKQLENLLSQISSSEEKTGSIKEQKIKNKIKNILEKELKIK